jgi:phosphatidate cytidylyltransferase
VPVAVHMLKQRILTAMVLMPLTVWALFAWSALAFAVFLGVFILVGAWEWTALCGLQKLPARLVYVAFIGVSGGAFAASPSLLLKAVWMWPLMALVMLWWLWAFIEVLAYQDVRQGFLASLPGKLLSGFFVLVPAWLAPLVLRDLPQGTLPDGRWLTLYLLGIVWVADSGAYFAGHRWGRTKLAPHVSPGKTWEGVVGGLVAVLALALLAGVFGWRFAGNELVVWVTLSLTTAFVSVFGDLFESRAKRAAGVKDSGSIFPGHGGVLDRIDAFTAAAPVFTLAWLLWRTPAGEL